MSRKIISGFLAIAMMLSMLFLIPIMPVAEAIDTGSDPAPPLAKDVEISGSPVEGETLSGYYDFEGTEESGTTFRWLSDSGTSIPFFTTMNITAVSNGPTNATTFILIEETLIASIEDYHWNGGAGQVPGTIMLQESDGTIYGPWDAVGVGGNLYWKVQPYITLPAGTYTIIDSSNETWSNNAESGYRGMVNVWTTDYSNNLIPIDGANEQTYLVSSDDIGKMIQFEVTVKDIDDVTGIPVASSPIGPIRGSASGNIQFTSAYYGVYEEYNGYIRASRIDGSSGTITVDYSTADGTAIAWQHYKPVSGTLTWEDGDTDNKVIPCTIMGDSQYNGYLYFDYTLSNPTGGATIVSPNPATIQVSDNDAPPTPQNLRATAGNKQVTLEWDEVDDTHYVLYFSTTPKDFTEQDSVGVYDNTSYTMADLTNGTKYYFMLEAVHSIYHSEATAVVDATPTGPSTRIRNSNASPTIKINTSKRNTSIINSTEISATTKDALTSATISAATVNALLDKVASSGGQNKKDLIEFVVNTQKDTKELTLKMKQEDWAKISDQTEARLAISSPFISVVLDSKALDTISASGSGKDIVFSASLVDKEQLSEKNQALVKNRPVYDLNIMNGDKQVSDFNGGHATVSIPYTLAAKENPHAVLVYYLTDSGRLLTLRGHYDPTQKVVTFKTNHFSKFIVGYNPLAFSDVKEEAWYKDAVDFIAAREISTGTGNNQYSPSETVSRAEFVVLLMKAYQIDPQSQSDLSQVENFTDLGNSPYADYLLTAKSLGIIHGIGNNSFAPNKEISRQEVFVMLYDALQAMDEIPSTTNDLSLSSFTDADQIAGWASSPLSAMVKSGTVSGYRNKLNPTAATTRAEITQLFYNLLSK